MTLPSILLPIGFNVNVQNPDVTQFYSVGVGTIVGGSVEAEVERTFRNTGTIKNLFVNVIANSILVLDTVVTTRKNQADTSQTISIPAGATGIFEDTTNNITLATTDEICIKSVTPTSASGSISQVIFSTTFTPDSDTYTNLMSRAAAGAAFPDNTTRYSLLSGTLQANSGSGSGNKFKNNGTLKNGFIYVQSNTASVTSTIVTRKNPSTDGNVTISVPSDSTGIFEDTTNTDTVATNDVWQWKTTVPDEAGTNTLTIIDFHIGYLTTDSTFPLLSTANSVGQAYGTNTTAFIRFGQASSIATESEVQLKSRFTFLANTFFVDIATNSFTTLATIFSVRKNSSDAITISVPAGATGDFENTTDTSLVVTTDLINFGVVTPNESGTIRMSIFLALASNPITISKSFTVDAILKATQAKTFAIDSILVNQRTKSFTLDAYLVYTKQFTIDAYLQKSFTKTFTLDSILVNRLTKDFSIDAILKKSDTPKTFTIDAILVNQRTKTFLIDSILKKSGQLKEFSIDANLLQTQTKDFTLDAILKATLTKPFTIDSLLKQSGITKNFTLDAYLVYTKSFSIDAILIKVITKEFTLDAYLLQTQTKSFLVDALLFLQPTKDLTIDAILKLSDILKTYTIDAILKATQSKTYTIDAILVQINSKTFTIDAILTKTQTKNYTIDAILKATQSKSYTLDAILKQTQTKSISINAILTKTQSKSYTIDAILKQVQSKTFSIDAILKLSNILKSFSLDAILTKIQSKNFTIDAILTLGGEKFFDVDAILIYVQSKTFTIDAILRLQPIKPFTINAILRYTQTKSFFLDAILVDIFNTQIYAVYSTNSGELELKSVSSSNSILGASYATNQGDIELK